MDDNDVLGFFNQLFGDNLKRQKKELTKMYIQGKLTKEQFIENFHFHDLRRTVGTWLLTAGVRILIFVCFVGNTIT